MENKELLTVGLGDRSYPIFIGENTLHDLGPNIKRIRFPKRIGLVSNTTVFPLYGEKLVGQLEDEGFVVTPILLPDGEAYKNLKSLESIYDALIENRFDRHSGLIALGGGVIGDITGFAAATFLRGVPFVQVPTTLLSQVDSSVGGKTAVNHPLGKNLIGAFYQPKLVLIDVTTLRTLSEDEFKAGIAEIIKYGIIRDRDFFFWLQQKRGALLDQNSAILIETVKKSCQIKANIVENDEKEANLRAILNFGHTFGHAVESLTKYTQYRHGEAVAIGMCFGAALSMDFGLCTASEFSSIRQLIVDFGLPTKAPEFPAENYLEAMSHDKKIHDGTLRFILNEGIGDCQIRDVDTSSERFVSRLKQFLDMET